MKTDVPSLKILSIHSLDLKGNGIATHEGNALPVPYALPGEKVEVEIFRDKDRHPWGKVRRRIQSSEKRNVPPCKHFTDCGGCSVQHLFPEDYLSFKKRLITELLKNAEIKAEKVEEPVILGPRKRRRVDFKGRMTKEGLVMGFHQKHSKRRTHLEECLVVRPEIEALFAPLSELLGKILLPQETAHIFITAASNGIDLLLAGFKRPFEEEEKELMRHFAAQEALARLTVQVKRKKDVLNCPEDPYVLFAGEKIPIHPQVFLQASPEADEILAREVLKLIPKETRKIADLFCGRGTLSIPVAKAGYDVDGFEADLNAIKALNSVALEGLQGHVRDLFSLPLTTDELNHYECVIANPPRTGIKDQVLALGSSQLKCFIYVSCGPASFVRDAKILCELGFKLTTITPVDQFMWSHHLEIVSCFIRP